MRKNSTDIEERFLPFVYCHAKTGKAIAALICKTLENLNIPLEDCSRHGHDNGSYMSEAQNYITSNVKISKQLFRPVMLTR